MTETPTYAVVDIEATGGNVSAGDRIIQIGCVLIEERKIVQQFSITINPDRNIPKEIEYLTGINNQSVANAPYFEDVAVTIYNLLEGCIFVAHNIQFDYSFLSDEFKRCGLPELIMPGIDTVELAQILFPTEPSYSLNDLMVSFELEHDNPHQADSDALATAELLILMMEKVSTLPLVTIEKLVEFSAFGIMNNQDFFLRVLSELKKDIPPLPDELFIVHGLALKKKSYFSPQENYREIQYYPYSDDEKKQLFDSSLSVRPSQFKMMNEVYNYFLKKPKEHYAIEAATGVGKTIGYLLPVAYLASKKHPYVISTYTTLLQQQLLEKDAQLLNHILPFDVSLAVLKSKSHYIHLLKFEGILNEPVERKIEAVYRMRVLVWLTETSTGDLDELNLTTYDQPFWNKLKHRGWLGNPTEDKWYKDDFYLHAKGKVDHASIIVTNHAFLCHDFMKEKQEIQDIEHLIIDEAQHLGEVAIQSASEKINYFTVQKMLKWIGKEEDKESFIGQLSLFSEQLTEPIHHDLYNLEISSYFLSEEWSFLADQLLTYTKDKELKSKSGHERVDFFLEPNQIEVMGLKKTIKKISTLLEETMFLGKKVSQKIRKEEKRLNFREQYIVNDFFDLFTEFEKQHSFLTKAFKQGDQGKITWFSFKQKSPKNSLIIHLSVLDSGLLLEKKLVQQVPAILYTGATLQVNKGFDYFKKQVGEKELKTYSISSPYNYNQQMKLWIPEGIKPISTLSTHQYTKMIVHYIELIAKNSKKNILVLFTSYETLQSVYDQLQKRKAFAGKELLAQGVSGSRERIVKRFFRSQGNVLLGASSFWEGVDLPGKTLEILVVTRLPFDSPERPFIQAKYQWLERQGKSSFYEEALPKAVLRLKQGVGRLIRSESDKGMLLLLDERILSASYSSYIQKALPEGLRIKEIKENEIKEEIRNLS